jgi:hypothetical protein
MVGTVLCASLWLGVGQAGAAPGDMTYQGCITGDTAAGPTGTNACAQISSATATGALSGLDSLYGISVSPDGKSAYALSHVDDAIARFSRNPSTGALTYQDCISGRTETTACAQLASAKSGGLDSGFDEPYGIAISPNGASVYVSAQEDDSIATFSRNTSTGALTYQGCVTGETATGPAPGNGSCATAIPSKAPSGTNSGIDKVRNLAIDANGESLYATSGQDDAIARFTRNTGTGVLTYVNCFTDETATGTVSGTAACTDLPGIFPGGSDSGFDNPQAVTVSPNGASVYVGSGNDASVTRFSRTAGTGALALQDCISADSNVPPAFCTILPGGTSQGADTGFDNIRGVVVSPDGSSLYMVGGFDASIVQFSRNTGTGALTFQGCISGDTATGPTPGTGDCSLIPNATSVAFGDDSGWSIGNNPPTLAINPDGTQVFFGTSNDSSVVALDRNLGTGALSFRRCLTGETQSAAGCGLIPPSASLGTNTGLDNVFGLALSPDGRSLYTAAVTSDAVARFAIEPTPVVSPPPVVAPSPNPPVITKKKKKKKCKKKHKKRAAEAKKKCKKKKRR